MPAPVPKPPKKDSRYITTSERVGTFIGWAILLSLALHVAVGAFFPNLKNQHEETEVEKVSMTRKIRVRVPTPPPPTPTPRPTPTPPPHSTPPPKKQQVVQPKPLKVNLVKTTSANKSGESTEHTVSEPAKGTQNGVPGGTGTAAPVAAPTGTPKPACANPNVEATVTNAVQPEYPESALEAGVGAVQVLVEVTVGSSGNLVGATIYKSSGNMSIDQSALRAARQSSYSPKLTNCEPTTGNYLFRADFQPG